MKVMVSDKERRQLEHLLKIMNNSHTTIAKRRLAKSKFDLIYERATRRNDLAISDNKYKIKSSETKSSPFACMQKGEN